MNKQNIAMGKLHQSWKTYKKENGIKWYHFIFPSKELRQTLDGYNFRAWSIANHPEYLDEYGNSRNEVEVDFELGKDMTKYGWTSQMVNKAKKNGFNTVVS